MTQTIGVCISSRELTIMKMGVPMTGSDLFGDTQMANCRQHVVKPVSQASRIYLNF